MKNIFHGHKVLCTCVKHVYEAVPAGAGQVALGGGGPVEAVLEAEHLRVVSLDLAELVHELQLVDADVARPVAAGEVLPVGADADTAHPVPLIVQRVLLARGQRGVRLLDEAQLGVDVESLEELLAVDVPPVESVGGHVPDADGVVRAAGDEAARRQDRLLAVAEAGRVGLQAPDAGRVVEERVRLPNLEHWRKLTFRTETHPIMLFPTAVSEMFQNNAYKTATKSVKTVKSKIA